MKTLKSFISLNIIYGFITLFVLSLFCLSYLAFYTKTPTEDSIYVIGTLFSVYTVVGIFFVKRAIEAIDKSMASVDNTLKIDNLDDLEVSDFDEINELNQKLALKVPKSNAIIHKLSPFLIDMESKNKFTNRSLADTQKSVKSILDSIGHISEDVSVVKKGLELTGSKLQGIAASVKDNSVSLNDLTTSIDDVSQGSELLSEKVKQTSESVLTMTSSIRAVSEHIERLASRAEGAAGSMTQIDVSAVEIRGHAREASDLSGKMATSAVEGATAVRESVDGIRRSYSEILAAAESMTQLKESSKYVGEILKIINEINDKTKLLALNAAIIAAQSGEHGKSFAVVAHEIKNLSDKTSTSTGEISKIISSIQDGIGTTIKSVRRGEEILGGSVEMVERAGRLLDNIQETAEMTFGKSKEISGLADKQTSMSESVNISVSHVARMVDEIRRRLHEYKKGGEMVDESVTNMQDLTEHVKSAVDEQVETSRFLAEAFIIIDNNLRTVLDEMSEHGWASSEVMDRTEKLIKNIHDAQIVLNELSSHFENVEDEITGLKEAVS